LALGSALAEGTTCWLLNGAVFTLPNYARTSTILGAVAVFLLIRKARHLPGRRLLALLGRFSLGFYALHTFFQFGLRPLLPPLVVTTSQGTVTFSLPLSIATLAATAAAIWVLSRTPLRRFVM
jgi:fucose 4-O-acetylase-like acetyltransferase